MASFRAIEAVSEAVIHQLRSNMRLEDFSDRLDPQIDPQLQLDFRVFTSRDFASSPITNGVSLFLYRIFANGAQRTPPGRVGPDGRRQQTQLPVEMHFLLTVWGGEASLQHALAGWMMRVMEDSSLLPAGVLTAVAGSVFRADETVELRVFYRPDQQTALPRTALPDYLSVLTQSRAEVWMQSPEMGASPGDAWTGVLEYGRELNVTTTGERHLLISPAVLSP